MVRKAAYSAGSRGGELGTAGLRAAHAGAPSTTGSTSIRCCAAAATKASSAVKSWAPRTGSIVRQSTAIRVLPTPEDCMSASSAPRSTVGARSGPSDMTPKNERGTAAWAGAQTVNAATAATAASRARDRQWP